MAQPDAKGEPRPEERRGHTDDERAREAVENPLETAAKPAPKTNGLSWVGPAAAVGVAVVLLLILVAVFA